MSHLVNDSSEQTGFIRKMHVKLQSPIDYSFALQQQLTTKCIPIGDKIGKRITLSYTGNIHCIHCDRKIKKSFNQGYCYPCFRALAQCDMCMMKPEQCHYEAGTCREPQWGLDICFKTHYVYLANSSGVKVGITRHTQLPTRWIDQGAVQALPILKVTSRLLSGLCEVVIKNYVADKTQWQRMLKGGIERVDLTTYRDNIFEKSHAALTDLLQQYGEHSIQWLDEKPIDIAYPIIEHPKTVKSFNFDKTAVVEGRLMGIKGQYLIFDTGVLNIRKFGGYEVTMSY